MKIILLILFPISLFSLETNEYSSFKNENDNILFKYYESNCIILKSKTTTEELKKVLSKSEVIIKNLIFNKNIQLFNQVVENYKNYVSDFNKYSLTKLDIEYYEKNKEIYDFNSIYFIELRNHYYQFERRYKIQGNKVFVIFDQSLELDNLNDNSYFLNSLVKYFSIEVDLESNDVKIFSINN